MLTKTVAADFQAEGDAGRFAAMVSVFDVIDKANDRVVRGAFAQSLARWRKRGATMPVCFSHDWSVSGFIGGADPEEVRETDEGLLVEGQLWLDTEAGKTAHRLLKSGAVREWSFAYDVKNSRWASDGVNELLELDLLEVGPTLVGCNSETRTLAVKGGLVDVSRPLVLPTLSASQMDAVGKSLDVVRGVLARLGSTAPASVDDDLRRQIAERAGHP